MHWCPDWGKVRAQAKQSIDVLFCGAGTAGTIDDAQGSGDMNCKEGIPLAGAGIG